jgi:hypothetical protein
VVAPGLFHSCLAAHADSNADTKAVGNNADFILFPHSTSTQIEALALEEAQARIQLSRGSDDRRLDQGLSCGQGSLFF